MVAMVAMVMVLAVGCFVDQPGDTTGSSGTTSATSSTGLATSGEPGTSGATSTTTAPGTTVEPTSGSTTGSTDPTTGAADPTTTTMTTDPTMGSICPAADGFPNIDPPDCRACLSASCCGQVSECAADPGCSAAWSCTQSQPCILQWETCPGYAEQKGKLDAISACGEASCGGVCTLGPCTAEQAACEQDPECQAVDACVQANCSNPCPPDNPDCILACWGMCQKQHPRGAKQWETLLLCITSKCP